MQNSWHDVESGDLAPDLVNAIIEIPKGSRSKYELDKDTGLLRLDRVLYSAMFYPANYGFIPRTYCEDGDPLDILVLGQFELPSLCLVRAKPIGVMRMLDAGQADDKIIAVAQDDISVNHINDISELREHFLRELRNFFEDYKKLEHKTVQVEEFLPKDIAKRIIKESIEDYKTDILPGLK
jgi:inorganic pyrophosphatase